MKCKAILLLILGLLFFTCNNSMKSNKIEITNQTIIGTWIGQDDEYMNCVKKNGYNSFALATIKCEYHILTDSIFIKHNQIISSSCDSISPDSLLDTSTIPQLIKSSWKLINDSLNVYELIKFNFPDGSDTTYQYNLVITLTPYTSNKIIFNYYGIIDTCQRQ